MEEITSQLREELQEIIDKYKTRLSVPRIMNIVQDVFHKTLSIKYHPEYHPELHEKEMAEEWLDERYFRDMGVRKPCKEAYFAGFESCNQQLVKAKEIIKDLLKVLPKENIEGIYETIEAAEGFLRDTDYTKHVRPGSEPNAFRGPNAICSQGPDGCCATYKGGWDKCKDCGMYNGDTKCID